RTVQLAGLKNGLILLTAGFYNNCIRLLPPINIPLPFMAKALDLLEDSLELALAGKASSGALMVRAAALLPEVKSHYGDLKNYVGGGWRAVEATESLE